MLPITKKRLLIRCNAHDEFQRHENSFGALIPKICDFPRWEK